MAHSRTSDHPDARAARLAADSHGVLTVHQLYSCGLTPTAIHRRVRAGRLHRLHTGVYAVGHTALSPEGQLLAAVRAVHPSAVATGLSAAQLWGCSRLSPQRIHVVATGGRRQAPGMRILRTRSLPRADTRVRNGVPTATVARALVEAPVSVTAAQRANILHEAAYRGHVGVPAMRSVLARSTGRAGYGLTVRALRMHLAGSAGTQSLLEDSVLAGLLDAGLPEPLVTVPVPIPGKPLRPDFHWPQWRVCLEVDGPGHSRRRTANQDAERDARLRAAGYRVVRVRASQARYHRSEVIREVLAAARP